MERQKATAVMRSLLLVLLPFVAVLVFPASSPGNAVLLGTAVAVLVVAALATSSRYELVQVSAASNHGPSDDERCLRGSFRRQSSPDAPGRPQPRAPGIGR